MKRHDRKSDNDQSDTEVPIDELEVHLKPIMGFKPAQYVPVVWAGLIIFVAFFVLLYPGLRNNGALVTIHSTPPAASAYVDGVRVGSTPVEVFVPKGEHEFSAVHPAYEGAPTSIDVPGRIFGSWPFPKTVEVGIRMTPDDLEMAHAREVADFAEWSLGDEAGPQFQIPWNASKEAIWRSAVQSGRTSPAESTNPADPTGNSGKTGGRTSSTEWLFDYIVHASHETQVADVVRAGLLHETGAAVVSPGSIAEAVYTFVQAAKDSQRLDSFARSVLEPSLGDRSVVAALAAFAEDRSQSDDTEILGVSIELDEQAAPPARIENFAGVEFGYIPGGRYILGYPLRQEEQAGVAVQMEPFRIMTQEVSQSLFERFLNDTPQWRREYIADLLAANLVSESYLEAYEPFQSANEPVHNISWYAAEAFCRWFDDRLQAAGAPYRATLPSSLQWEYAAFLNGLGANDVITSKAQPVRVGSGRPGALGLYHMEGNLWEWGADWFAPNRYLRPRESVRYGAMKTVVGGSYMNETAEHNDVGAFPPHWCSPFQGFRVALVSESTGR